MTWFALWPGSGGGVLDSRVRAALDSAPVGDFRAQGFEEVRKNFNAMAAKLPRPDEKIAGAEDRSLPGGLKVRIYRPEGKGPVAALLFFHGGGWVVGDLDSHDHVCRSLCRRAGVIVISVDYRLAPETPFPGALDDCETALRWAAENAASLGIDPKRIAVGGDSAGAQLAIGLALRVRAKSGPSIAFQLLIYPVTDRNFETASYREFASGYGLTRDNMRWFWERYLVPGDLPSEAAPLRETSLKGLPPAFVLTAEFDILRDEGEAFARRLHKEGVPVRGLRIQGMNHGFIRMAAVYPQADHAVAECASALREAIGIRQ